MKLGQCHLEDIDLGSAEKLDWELHPVGLFADGGGIGTSNNRYFLGALLWNVVLVLVPLGVLFTAAGLRYYWQRHKLGQDKTFVRSLARVRAPGFGFAPFLYLTMGISLPASHLSFYPDNGPPLGAVIGWCAMLFMGAVPVLLWFLMLRPSVFNATCVQDPRLDPASDHPMSPRLALVYNFFFGKRVWVSGEKDGQKSYFVECLGIAFESYRPGKQWWLVPEIGHLVVLSWFPNWKAASRAACTVRNGCVCLLLGAVFVGVVYHRPYTSPFEASVQFLLTLCNFCAVVLMTIALGIGDEAPDALWRTALTLLAIAAFAQFGVLLITVAQYVNNTTAQQQRRLWAMLKLPAAMELGLGLELEERDRDKDGRHSLGSDPSGGEGPLPHPSGTAASLLSHLPSAREDTETLPPLTMPNQLSSTMEDSPQLPQPRPSPRTAARQKRDTPRGERSSMQRRQRPNALLSPAEDSLGPMPRAGHTSQLRSYLRRAQSLSEFQGEISSDAAAVGSAAAAALEPPSSGRASHRSRRRRRECDSPSGASQSFVALTELDGSLLRHSLLSTSGLPRSGSASALPDPAAASVRSAGLAGTYPSKELLGKGLPSPRRAGGHASPKTASFRGLAGMQPPMRRRAGGDKEPCTIGELV